MGSNYSDQVDPESAGERILRNLNIRRLQDWEVFVGRLEEAVEKGDLKPVPKLQTVYSLRETWYMDVGTGQTYYYCEPGECYFAQWTRFDPTVDYSARVDPKCINTNGLRAFETGGMDRLHYQSTIFMLNLLIEHGKIEETTKLSLAQSTTQPMKERTFRDLLWDEHYSLIEDEENGLYLWAKSAEYLS